MNMRAMLGRYGGRRLARPLRRRLPGLRVRWGNLRRTRPLCVVFGETRGTPVDRFYIDRFVAAHADDVRGRVLEVKEADYAVRHHRGVTAAEVVDIDPDNPRATIIADLCEPGSLPAARYDAIVLTQTLHLLRRPDDALLNMWQSLAPGGTLLITVPSASKLDRLVPGSEFWRYVPDGLRELITRTLPEAEVSVEGHGNVLTMVAFLMGMAMEELTPDELALDDPSFPLNIGAAVRRPTV